MTTLKALGWAAVSSKVQTDEEKMSLPEQKRTIENYARAQGWHLLDVLTVPGHSRRFLDFHELKLAAQKEGINAFIELERHWQAQDFDVLIVRDGDRFARTQALHAYITERTIDAGAQVYSLSDGWVGQDNYRMWIALGGYKAAGDVDRLVKLGRAGRRARVRRGLTGNGMTPMSHKTIRDDMGRALRIEVDEAMRPLFNDLAVLLLEGVAFQKLEPTLKRRFGHVNPRTGRAYSKGYMRKVLYSPMFWGHVATIPNRQPSGLWALDDLEPAPENVVVVYNQHEAMYTGQLAENIKAELRRRASMAGRTNPNNSRPLSGVMICGECGYVVSYAGNPGGRGYHYYKCITHKHISQRGECSQRKSVREDRVFDYLNALFKRMIERGTFTLIDEGEAQDGALRALQAEIKQLEGDMRQLIQNQTRAPQSSAAFYEEEIKRTAQRLDIVRKQAQDIELKLSSREGEVRAQALDELKQKSLSWFWDQEGRFINQTLHKIFGTKRLVILEGEILGIAEKIR